MQSAVFCSTRLPKTQELRLVNLLEKTPRFSPWGVKNWTAPKGFIFQTIDHVPVPETVLSRDCDHSAVVFIERYSNLVFASQDHIVLTNVKDVVPTLRIISIRDLASRATPVTLRGLETATLFPFVNREEVRDMVPMLPRHLCAHYMIGDLYYTWNWDSETGLYRHEELTWFNRTNPDILTESITKLTRDPISGMLVGEGNNVPPFVLSADCSRLMTFIRTYDASTGRVNNGHLLDKWRERLGSDAARAMLL